MESEDEVGGANLNLASSLPLHLTSQPQSQPGQLLHYTVLHLTSSQLIPSGVFLPLQCYCRRRRRRVTF